MKQFKVNSKNTVYNVFADSEVEAVNKVKEVESKINDETLLNTVNNISRWAGGNSQINRILSSGKKVTASQIVSLYEKNKGMKISNPNQRSQITSLVGRLSGFARDSVEVGDEKTLSYGEYLNLSRNNRYEFGDTTVGVMARDSKLVFGVRWSSLGMVTADKADKFLNDLKTAIAKVKSLNAEYKNTVVSFDSNKNHKAISEKEVNNG